MDWYYAIGREKQGPFDENEFKSFVESGTVTDKTLVWNKTMTDWAAFEKVKPKADENLSVADPASDSALKVSKQDEQDPILKTCSECGKSYTEDELVPYRDFLVCASCKPAFLQKIQEGVAIDSLVYAGFWIRFGAKVIDGLILGVMNYIIAIAFSALIIPVVVNDPENFKKVIIPSLIINLLQWSISIFYSTFFVGKYSATPGKMACGLKVVTAENDKVSYLRAFGRFWGEFVSSIILGIGFIMAAFDSEKRTLHDRICSTRVIKNR